MTNKTQMKTICITVIVMNVIAAVTCVISKDGLSALNHITIALSWGIILILIHKSNDYYDEI